MGKSRTGAASRTGKSAGAAKSHCCTASIQTMRLSPTFCSIFSVMSMLHVGLLAGEVVILCSAAWAGLWRAPDARLLAYVLHVDAEPQPSSCLRWQPTVHRVKKRCGQQWLDHAMCKRCQMRTHALQRSA